MIQHRSYKSISVVKTCFFFSFLIPNVYIHVLCKRVLAGVATVEGPEENSAVIDDNIGTYSLNDSRSSNLNKHQNGSLNPTVHNRSAVEEWVMRSEADASFFKTKSARKPRSLSSLWCDRGDQCSRSLCPWRERYDIERARTPVILKYAECLSTKCNYNFGHLDQNVQSVLNFYTTCDVVRTDLRVIENGSEKWLTDWPIACICTRRQMGITDNVVVSSLFGEPVQSADLPTFDTLQNSEPQGRLMSAAHSRRYHVTRQERRLIRQYRRQQRQRINTESWEDLMRRRQRERNASNS